MAIAKYVVVGAILSTAAAAPAAAEDCFIKVSRPAVAKPAAPKAAAPHRAVKPAKAKPAASTQARKPVTKPRKVVAAAKPAAPMKKLPESSYAMRTDFAPAPPSTECDTKPSIMAALPPEARPPAQRLLDEVAGPPAESAESSPPMSLAALPVSGPGGGGFPARFGPRGGGGGGTYITPPGDGGETPTTPTDPTDPTTPTKPTDPTDPSTPTDPTDPSGRSASSAS